MSLNFVTHHFPSSPPTIHATRNELLYQKQPSLGGILIEDVWRCQLSILRINESKPKYFRDIQKNKYQKKLHDLFQI